MDKIKKLIAVLVIIVLILNLVGLIVLKYSPLVFWGIIIVAFAITYFFYRKK